MHLADTTIENIAVHAVGNKQLDEPLTLSHELLNVSDEVKNMLKTYFLYPFKTDEYFQLFDEEGVETNDVYKCASAIFDNPDEMLEQSLYLAQHLYNQCNHPKIKDGEFYVVYFKNCVLDDEQVDAIGLFKAETKDTFLKIHQENDKFVVESDFGFGLNKLDKGCLIFNTEKERGYVVAVVDNTNKNAEAQYWMDNFLHIRQRKDEFYNTQNVLTMCKEFVTDYLPEQFEVSKADQAEILNKSVNFFKENETFEMDDFKQEVIGNQDLIESFDTYKEEYQQANDMVVPESFGISDSALKKQSRNFKSVIKLDKNFHVYVHGDTKMIRKGVDPDTGMNYYQLFFEEEY
ncbi:MAG: nucleoid-associated protein [Bacteroidales bacterium]|nr:nucleoid-associated protein [Bacteroidales bacterium]